MALFGLQLVLTMVMASLLQKLGPYYSFGRFLLCSTGLVRYLHPSEEELKKIAGIGKPKGKGNKKQEENLSFSVPKSIEIDLGSEKISWVDVMSLKFYTQYQWLMDFAVCSSVVYFFTEIYFWLSPSSDELNLSMMWCLLVVLLSLKILLSLTSIYFGGGDEASGERSTVVLCGFTYLLIAMGLLLVSENNLEIGLDTAYTSFNQSASRFLNTQGVPSQGPASLITCRLTLAFFCALIGAFFTFPGMRMAKMHSDGLRYCEDSKFIKFFLNISFILPFLLTLLWVKPVARDYFTTRMWPGMTSPMLDSSMFETIRVVLVLLLPVVRVILMPRYLQAYLNMAHERITQLRRESGRIKAIELQKMVARVFYYLCVVTLQYITPVILCLFLTLMLKTMGGYTWSGFDSGECAVDDDVRTPGASVLPDEAASFSEATEHMSLSLASLKQVFNEAVLRGILGFGVWWCCFTMFTSSALGLLYHVYFATN